MSADLENIHYFSIVIKWKFGLLRVGSFVIQFLNE